MPTKTDRIEHDILSEMLQMWRSSVGLSQRELSKKLGRAPNYIGRIESGVQGMAVVDVVDIAAAMGKKPLELFAQYCDALPALGKP